MQEAANERLQCTVLKAAKPWLTAKFINHGANLTICILEQRGSFVTLRCRTKRSRPRLANRLGLGGEKFTNDDVFFAFEPVIGFAEMPDV